MSDQTQMNETFGYEVSVPVETPRGQTVTVQAGEQDGRHMMHAETPDQSEYYLEVLAYETFHDHARLAERQRAFLRDNSADGETTEPGRQALYHLEGTVFDFKGTLQGRWKERRFLFVDGPERTFRIVHDPTSELNVKAMQTVRLL